VTAENPQLEVFFSRGQKVSKNSKHWSNEKGLSSRTKIVQRNNSERSNATSQYNFCLRQRAVGPVITFSTFTPFIWTKWTKWTKVANANMMINLAG
jgi:hypothetical protein